MYAAVHPYSEINNQRETNTFTDFFDFGINHCEYKTFKALIHREVKNKFVSAACSYLLDSMVKISQVNKWKRLTFLFGKILQLFV